MNIGSTTATTISVGRSGQAITFPNYNGGGAGCTALETDSTGQIVCGSDDVGGSAGTSNWVISDANGVIYPCLLYTSPSPRDRTRSRMPSSA